MSVCAHLQEIQNIDAIISPNYTLMCLFLFSHTNVQEKIFIFVSVVISHKISFPFNDYFSVRFNIKCLGLIFHVAFVAVLFLEGQEN